MNKTANRRHNHFDLYDDLEKIKNAFADTAFDVKGKTGEMLSDSVASIKEKSTQFRDGVADYTAEKPLKSLGIALICGVALGYFLHK